MGSSIKDRVGSSKPQLVFLIVLSSVLTHVLGQVQPISAASSTQSETTSSSQPLWSYQVKPNSYINAPGGQPGAPYSSVPSLFDAFNGLSQRQGALSGSSFLSILPIILIAAGGMLLLLPFLTMMMASPFGGGFGGGYQGGFGYPQMAAMSKKRSLSGTNDQVGGQRGLIDLFESVSSAIEDLTRKYSPDSRTEGSGTNINNNNNNNQKHHRSTPKSNILAQQTGTASSAQFVSVANDGSGGFGTGISGAGRQATTTTTAAAANHKPIGEELNNNLTGGSSS